MMTSPAQDVLHAKPLRGLRVLVVDDEPVLASTFCLVLQFAGAIASSAGDGAQALTILSEQMFDVILCDKHMPVMNGPELIRELNRRGDRTPILLFVQDVDGAGARSISDLRIAGTLCKPLLPADLIEAIRAASAGS